MTHCNRPELPAPSVAAGHFAATSLEAAERLPDTARNKPIDVMLTTTLSLVPAIFCLTSTTPSMASIIRSLRMTPSSTRRSSRLSQSSRAAWPWGSGVILISQDSANARPVSCTQFSFRLRQVDSHGAAC